MQGFERLRLAFSEQISSSKMYSNQVNIGTYKYKISR